MREFDRLATERSGVASIVLMENAGRGAADLVVRELREKQLARVLVVTGSGNNGGDGYVVARRLVVLGISVEVLAVAPVERLSGDALMNFHAFVGVGGRVRSLSTEGSALAFQALSGADLIVDALFGTGLDRPVEGIYQEAIQRINQRAAFCVALDIPSGLDADTGRVLGVAVRADLTVTFAAYKLGLLTPEGRSHTGRIEIVDIGVPPAGLPEAGESALFLEAKDVAGLLPIRPPNSHKGSAGRLLVLAGSPGKVGAALLVASGALRAGAGLVTLAGTTAVADALDRRVLEAMTARIDLNDLETSLAPLLTRADAVVLGPGLGLDEPARRLVEFVVFGGESVVIADADAITHFQGRPEELARAGSRLVLTPHPAELGRLLGLTASEVEADRFSALTRAVRATEATVLLKGPHTLVAAPGLLPVIGRRGTSALSTGGTGDVLSGVIGALACTLPKTAAAFAGAYLHARAGELWARDSGSDRGLLAHEIAEYLPRARAELSAEEGMLPV